MNNMNKVKVGLMVVADPRIKREAEAMEAERHTTDKIKELGVQVITSKKIIVNEEEASKEAKKMKNEGACGIIYYTAWFLRANVIAGAYYASKLPSLFWAIPNPNDASLIGLGVAHGSLKELGILHKVVYEAWNETCKREILAWIRACSVKKNLMGARYGQVGGRCLSMMPADTDANQWRRMFGIDVDHAEQWTLIHEAEKIQNHQVKPLIEEWKKDFASIETSDDVLMKSAKLYLAGKKMFNENHWDFVGIKCQFELLDNYLAPCLPVALWNNEGLVVACESDMNGALTMMVLHQLSGRAVFFGDVQFIDIEKKILRVLNCGMAAPELAGGRKKVHLKNCPEFQGTFDETTGKYLCKGGACTHFLLHPGKATLARFGRIKGEYVLHISSGEAIDHSHDPNEFFGVAGVWPFVYFKLEEPVKQFVNNLQAHHLCLCYGEWKLELEELARLWGIKVL